MWVEAAGDGQGRGLSGGQWQVVRGEWYMKLLITMTTAGASVSFHGKSEGFRVNCRGGGETGLQQATSSQSLHL